MAYAYTFDARDKQEPDEDGYSRTKNNVSVTVTADTEEEASNKAQALISREDFKLEDIVELVSDGTFPVKGSRF